MSIEGAINGTVEVITALDGVSRSYKATKVAERLAYKAGVTCPARFEGTVDDPDLLVITVPDHDFEIGDRILVFYDIDSGTIKYNVYEVETVADEDQLYLTDMGEVFGLPAAESEVYVTKGSRVEIDEPDEGLVMVFAAMDHMGFITWCDITGHAQRSHLQWDDTNYFVDPVPPNNAATPVTGVVEVVFFNMYTVPVKAVAMAIVNHIELA